MLSVSYLLNLMILCPLLIGFALRPDAMTAVFGPETDARRILVCLYATLAIASAVGLILVISGQTTQARTLGAVLFSLQVLYKLMTVPMVGLDSPVVKTNLLVVGIHLITLWTMWRTV